MTETTAPKPALEPTSSQRNRAGRNSETLQPLHHVHQPYPSVEVSFPIEQITWGTSSRNICNNLTFNALAEVPGQRK